MGGHDYVIATSGHCFLCLKRVRTLGLEGHQGWDQTVPKIFSLHKIYQHLKLNLKEVLVETMPNSIPSSSLSVLEESELKGHLCEGCSKLTESFSKQFLELEEIQRKMYFSLRSIYERMEGIDGSDGGSLEEFKKEMLRRPETLLQFGVVEQLRNKTLERSSQKLSVGQPPVDPDDESLHHTEVQSSDHEDIDIKMEDHIVISHNIDPLMSQEDEEGDDSDINKDSTDLSSQVETGGQGPQAYPSAAYPETQEAGKKSKQQGSSGAVAFALRRRHLKTRRLWSYTCDHCGKKFPTMRSLTQHRSEIDTKSKAPEKMKLDVQRSRSDSIAMEMEVADNPSPDPTVHLELQMNEGTGTVKTEAAEVMSVILPDLPSDNDPPSPLAVQASVTGVLGNGHQFKCKFCPLRFNTREGTWRHMTEEHMFSVVTKIHGVPALDDPSFVEVIHPPESLDQVMQREGNVINPETRNYKCGRCPKEFSIPFFLKKHYKGAHVKKIFRCLLCNNVLANRTEYNRHFRNIHLHDTYKCNGCSVAFARNDLNQHLNTTVCMGGFKS